MATNFRLNESDSNNLSDRIINSADEVFKLIQSDDWTQKFLMKGEMTNKNLAIAHRRHKDANENIDDTWIMQIFRNLIKLTENSEEKKFFELCKQGMAQKWGDYNKKYETLFGKLNPKLLNTPMSQGMYSYKVFTLYNSEKGPFLRGLVPLMGMLMVCDRTLDYLKQNPNYAPNNLAKMFCYEDFDFKQSIAPLRQMIDSRTAQVSEAELEELSELFKRAVVYERLVANHNYLDSKWFEI